MGRQVVYCDGCGRILLEDEFVKGKAHVVDNRAFCVACRPVDKPPALETPGRAYRKVATSRIAIRPAPDTRRAAADEARGSRGALLVGGGLALAALAGGGVLLVTSGARDPGREKIAAAPPPPPAPAPPPVAPPPPAPAPGEESGAREFKAALETLKRHPADYAVQMQAFLDAERAAGSSPIAEEARKELSGIRRKISQDLSRLEEETAPPLANEEFRKVIETWEREKGRHAVVEWTRPAAERVVSLRRMADGRFMDVKRAAIEAKRSGSEERAAAAVARVRKWGFPDLLADLQGALASVPSAKGGPAAPPPGSKDAEALRARWAEAIAHARARDYPAALKSLEDLLPALAEPGPRTEAQADIELLRLAAAVPAEAVALLAKSPRGQQVALSCADDQGARVALEGPVHAVDAHRIEIRKGETGVTVPLGEVGAATLADLFRGRAAKKPETDARAAAVFCLVEGDVEAARKHGLEGLPAKYEEHAKEPSPPGPREGEARALFADSESGLFDPARAVDAVLGYRRLVKDYAETAFVRRNRGAIAARMEAVPKEFLLGAGDLRASGSFRLGSHNKMASCWISQRDLEGGLSKESYVQVAFSALPELEYRCWVQVGGCCLETFAFHVQASELAGMAGKEKVQAEPGSDHWLPVKLPSISVKKLHRDHVGPKEPDRWEWVAVPLPRFATAGAKTVRLLTAQKGFSVAHALVTSIRQAPPRDAELRDLEKLRQEQLGYLSVRWRPLGSILREWWNGIGGSALESLRSHAGFPDKPSGQSLEKSFESPVGFGNEYGTLLRGYVHPPVTGDFVFWIAGDDNCELWLSTDDNPANKRKIASVPGYTKPREWTKTPEQKSAPVSLVAGRRYYVEALHKEGDGEDFVSVGWQLPDGADERPIPGTRLSPFKK